MRKHSMMFNGITKDYVVTLRGKRRPPWAPLERKYVTVPGVPGAYNESTEVKPRPLDIPILIESKNLADLQKLKEDLADWLVTDEPKELILSDEPDRVYYAQIDGDLNVEEIISVGAGMLFFKCPDPYKYGEEKAKPFPAIETVKQDFAGKVVGSTVENPHLYKRKNTSTILSPNDPTWWSGYPQGELDTIKTLDGSTNREHAITNAHYSQVLFSFNLIEAIERQYGVIPVATQAEKVAWLKENVNKLTANWHGKGSNKMVDPNGKADFVGKVAGSTTANPHVFKRTSVNNGQTLFSPSGFTYEDPAYSDIQTLGGGLRTSGRTGVGHMEQHLFSFNLIEYIKRKYGYTPTVQWLKDNVESLTANWHGRGTNKMADPNGKADFAGKVSGSTVENPHLFRYRNGTTMPDPSTSTEAGQGSYDLIKTLDGSSTFAGGTSASGGIAQHLFSFNLIEYIKRKYGYTPTVQWLKDNISKLTCNWHGRGSGPSGNKAMLANWRVDVSEWTSGVSHTNSTITKLAESMSIAVPFRIDSSGFVHFLAYAEASDGTIASTIETDFVELEVELKPGADKATLTIWDATTNTWNPNPLQYHGNNTITKMSGTSTSISIRVDSSGFCHFLAYAEPSNGIAASTIETDYIELLVNLKPGADKATFNVWNSITGMWSGSPRTHAKSTIDQLQYSIPSYISNYIDSSGFSHFLSNAEPSNGIAASTIETDYVELLIEVKASYSPSYVDVGGTVETPPKFSITLKEPTTYLDIIGDNDYMRIGRPVNIDEFAIPERELILHDTMSTMTGWSNGQNSDIDGGVVSGTMESDGSKFIATSVGTGAAWHGPAKIKSLGQSLTDFHVSIQPILDNDELHKIGRIELYLLDSSKNAVGKLSIKDMSKGRGGNYAELRVGDNVVNNFLISEHGTNWDTWHNFNGLLELTKKGNKWTAYVCKFINGDRNNRTARKYVEWEDTANQFTRPVSYVVVHIAGYGTAVPSQMSIQDLQVYKLNTVTTGQIPYIGYTGDVFEFVHKESAIYRNGDYFMRKDFGSRFFNIKPGVNPIVFQPSDKILSVETRWRDRYK